MKKQLLELCTCRATHLGNHLGSPLGRTKLGDCWEIIPVRYCLNPEYMYQTIDILSAIRDCKFKDLSRDDIHPNYIETIKYTENMKVDAYLIEISSIKYIDKETPSGWGKYTHKQFLDNISKIRNICQQKKIIWVSAVNVPFTERHMNVFDAKESMFIGNKMKTRQIIDDWVSELSEPVIYPSKILSGKFAEDVFMKDKDLTHYKPEIEKLVRQEIEKQLIDLLS